MTITKFNNQKAFTMIELMATLVIVSIISTIAVKKTTAVADLAETTVGQSVIVSLNANELRVWALCLIDKKYKTDFDVWERKSEIFAMGGDVRFKAVSQTSATAIVGGSSCALKRIPSTPITSARWEFR